MSRLAQLLTLAQVQAVRRSGPKPSTKLDRAIANKTARLDDATQLRVWALAVKTRDQWKDRKTGVRVLRTLTLDPLRAEAHHIEPKGNRATRYDVRNGICLSLETHLRVEQNRLRIVGSRFFVKGGVRYIDGSAPVTFEPG